MIIDDRTQHSNSNNKKRDRILSFCKQSGKYSKETETGSKRENNIKACGCPA